MVSVGWLQDASEESLRSALSRIAPDLAELPIRMNPTHAASNPLWWSASAVIDGRFVVKFAWSEIRARRLWREGVLLQRLANWTPALPVPEPLIVHREPALLITYRATGVPLSWDWARGMAEGERSHVAHQLAGFLAELHSVEPELIGDLDVVRPTPQASTELLRDRFQQLVDAQRGAKVMQWCEWIDGILGQTGEGVLVHGDFHGYNQVWDRASTTLRAVVDFEESGVADRHYDLRYLPAYAPGVELVLDVLDAYAEVSGRRLAPERVMAWHLLTALGDALWRTAAGVALPGGGTPTTTSTTWPGGSKSSGSTHERRVRDCPESAAQRRPKAAQNDTDPHDGLIARPMYTSERKTCRVTDRLMDAVDESWAAALGCDSRLVRKHGCHLVTGGPAFQGWQAVYMARIAHAVLVYCPEALRASAARILTVTKTGDVFAVRTVERLAGDGGTSVHGPSFHAFVDANRFTAVAPEGSAISPDDFRSQSSDRHAVRRSGPKPA